MLSVRNVALGISGGLDSCVAAILLKNKGLNVIGVFMKNWDSRDENGMCSSAEDLEDARYICKRLKIQFHEVSFVKEYWNDVFVPFVNDYQSGSTPNPDIMCNKYIKFKAFFDHAINNLKVDAIAMGHYAKTSFGDFLENYKSGVNVRLLTPKDVKKDQTFFLSQVSQEALRRTMFPLSTLTRDQVKEIAIANGFQRIVKKQKSTGICFIGCKNFSKFISGYVSSKPGNFINFDTGEVKGKHEGLHLWTLGQRSRLPTTSQEGAFYIARKIANTSDIYVACGWNHGFLFHRMFFTGNPYWIAEPPDLSYQCEVDFRFQHCRTLTKCDLVELKSGSLLASLPKPLRAITPGQYAVFYRDNECLGSAKITNLGPSEYVLGNTVSVDYEEYEKPCAVG